MQKCHIFRRDCQAKIALANTCRTECVLQFFYYHPHLLQAEEISSLLCISFRIENGLRNDKKWKCPFCKQMRRVIFDKFRRFFVGAETDFQKRFWAARFFRALFKSTNYSFKVHNVKNWREIKQWKRCHNDIIKCKKCSTMLLHFHLSTSCKVDKPQTLH